MYHNPSTDSTSTEPTRFCCHCSEPCATFVQEVVFRGVTVRPPTVAMTCVESSCPLCNYTLTDSVINAAKMAEYDATISYDILTGKLLPAYVRYGAKCHAIDTREDRKLRSLMATGRAR